MSESTSSSIPTSTQLRFRQAIRTRYHGYDLNGNKKMTASSSSGHRASRYYDSNLSEEQNHFAIMQQLCERLGWNEDAMRGGRFGPDVYWVDSNIA